VQLIFAALDGRLSSERSMTAGTSPNWCWTSGFQGRQSGEVEQAFDELAGRLLEAK
jgi:hypothetical protein